MIVGSSFTNQVRLRQVYRSLLRIRSRALWTCAFALPLVIIVPALFRGASAQSLGSLLLGVLLAFAIVTDLLWRRIFNWITGPILAWVLALAAVGGQSNLLDALTGAAVCFGAMLLLHSIFGGGEGDVKLFAVIGAVLGIQGGLDVLITGYLLAAAFGLILMAGRACRRMAKSPACSAGILSGTLPMAPFFGAAVVLNNALVHGVGS